MGWRRFLKREAWDAERTREMDAHLQMQVDDYVAAGMPPEAAWQRARREFGNVRAIREEIYDMNSIALLEHLLRDARYAVRILRRSPGFTLTALLTLALAIGVNIAVFSLVDAALLKPLPYPHPDRLTLVSSTIREKGEVREDIAQHGLTWETIRDQASTVDAAVFSSWPAGVNLVTGSTASYVQQQRAGAGFFRVLGVAPAVGREFSAEEDAPGGPAAAILSHELWQRLFGGDSSAVGRPLTLRGEPYRIVGVMPRGFRTSVEADVWTPLRASRSGEGDGENYTIMARLRSGVTLPQAQAEIAALGRDVFRQRPSRADVTVDFSLVPMQRGLTAPMRETLLMLWAAVAIILIIACVNLAGLLIARASTRRREIATRMALGSGKAAVLRQLLVESVIVAAAGGLLGLLAGYGTLDLLRGLTQEMFEIPRSPSLDLRAVLAAAAFSAAAGLGFGTAPALVMSRLGVARGLTAGGRTATASRNRPRKLLLVAQVALGVVLLVAAGLLLRSFAHLRGLEPGFNPDGLTVATVSLQDARYRSGARIQQLFAATAERLRATPGVTGAAVSLGVPYERLLNLGFRQLDGPQAVAPGRTMTSASYVTDAFFDVMQIGVRAGRAFDARDTAAAPAVAIVSETFARTYFPAVPAAGVVGHRIGIAGRDREIVGIAGDVQVRPGWGDLGPLAPMPVTYLPVTQLNDAFLRVVHGWFSPAFIVRGSGGVRDVESTVRRALDASDPLLPLAEVRSMPDVQREAIAPARLMMLLLATLAAAAVLLAAVGIHGLIATSVTERTREMAIRMALGSTPVAAMRAIAAPGAGLALVGVAAGAPLAAMFGSLVRHVIWGVEPGDPATFLAAAAVVMAVATIASAAPAIRILRLDPATALRHE